ncbi:MAG: hypothetical protein ACD_28C00284G0004 [uncultured bacterium]|nr:MAG: hypothetical protein ACD_28C00284G0004 [uncultured bacterium]
MNLISSAQQSLVQTYKRVPMEIVKGQGSFVWDKYGKKYLDFYGGHAVALVGHCPPTVVKAIQKQIEKLLFYSNVFYTAPAITLAQKLIHTLSPEKYKVYFTNSGSEANETAIKMARKYTQKKHLISFKNSFHGRSITALGVTGIDSYHQFSPNLDEHTSFAELGNIESVKKLITDNTAAVICEPIQSLGGVKMADAKFYKALAKLCQEKNISLIVDEVQTGLGRTGTFWFSQQVEIQPDFLITAKGIASGLPLSCVLVKEKISETIKMGEHATTFGGGPVPCVAALATLKVILKKGFLENVKTKASYLKAQLSEMKEIEKVLGQGFLLGVQFKKSYPELAKNGLKNGLIVGESSDPSLIRLLPPLTTTKKEIDLFITLLKSTLNHEK